MFEECSGSNSIIHGCFTSYINYISRSIAGSQEEINLEAALHGSQGEINLEAALHGIQGEINLEAALL